MTKQKDLAIICDQRTIEDRNLGEKDGAMWDQRPFYLINKIFKNEYTPPLYVPIEDIGSYSLDGIDVAFLHIDLSVHNSDITNAINVSLPENIRVYNRKITDITKKHIETAYVSMGGPKLTLTRSDSYKGRGYKVMPSEEVSDNDWNNQDLLIQPFISSKRDFQEDGYGRMDRYVKFLEEIVCCSFFSKEPIIKRSTSIWEYFRDLNELERDFKSKKRICLNDEKIFYRTLTSNEILYRNTILELADLIGLDFGSIDTITTPDGKLYVLDVNKTPWERGIPNHFINLFRRYSGVSK